MEIVWTILLVISVFFFWLIGLLGLPGNWLMLVATGIYSLLVPTDETASVWWIAMGLLLVLAIVGEAVEMLASAHGVRKHGGSRRSAVLSFVGAIAGAIFGAVFGTGIMPVIGSLVGALLLSAAGALLGAFLGEQSIGRTVDDSMQVTTSSLGVFNAFAFEAKTSAASHAGRYFERRGALQKGNFH